MTEKTDWFIETNTVYEFTINGSDAVQSCNFKTLYLRYTRARKLLREILSAGKVKYNLLPELSTPQYGRIGKNHLPRVHFHGVIRFPTEDSIIEWLLVDAVKLAKYGSYQMNTFRPERWPGYCMKHKKLFTKLPGNYELQNTFEFDSIFNTCPPEGSGTE